MYIKGVRASKVEADKKRTLAKIGAIILPYTIKNPKSIYGLNGVISVQNICLFEKEMYQ